MVVAVEVSKTDGEERYPPSVRRDLDHIARLQTRHSITDVDQLASLEARSNKVMGRRYSLLVALGILGRGQDIDGRRRIITMSRNGVDDGWIFSFPFP